MPLAKLVALRERVNARLGRKDLTEANIKTAMEQIPYDMQRSRILYLPFPFFSLDFSAPSASLR